ncbi:hypothetical protein NDU88_006984 [Pleurodeles waltl]|uniref:Uncharacterized protein n=1 Tax=Pleurodeles waltl TaxID=8319 RepID=A0AAV7QNC2_PLEWA|nr:hypothetical protein NDU88_006984 [Pleurodeles waltl]
MVSLPASWCARLRQSLQRLLQVQVTSAKEWLHPQSLMASTLDVMPWAHLQLGQVVHHNLLHWTPASRNYEALIPASALNHQDILW